MPRTLKGGYFINGVKHACQKHIRGNRTWQCSENCEGPFTVIGQSGRPKSSTNDPEKMAYRTLQKVYSKLNMVNRADRKYQESKSLYGEGNAARALSDLMTVVREADVLIKGARATANKAGREAQVAAAQLPDLYTRFPFLYGLPTPPPTPLEPSNNLPTHMDGGYQGTADGIMFLDDQMILAPLATNLPSSAPMVNGPQMAISGDLVPVNQMNSFTQLDFSQEVESINRFDFNDPPVPINRVDSDPISVDPGLSSGSSRPSSLELSPGVEKQATPHVNNLQSSSLAMPGMVKDDIMDCYVRREPEQATPHVNNLQSSSFAMPGMERDDNSGYFVLQSPSRVSSDEPQEPSVAAAENTHADLRPGTFNGLLQLKAATHKEDEGSGPSGDVGGVVSESSTEIDEATAELEDLFVDYDGNGIS